MSFIEDFADLTEDFLDKFWFADERKKAFSFSISKLSKLTGAVAFVLLV
jgi:hypothetical protein